jgi:hypothetical protein
MSSEAVAEPPVTNTSPTELTPEELDQKLRLQIVDVSHGVGANAIDAADEYIREHSSQGGIKGFAKRIWFGNLARDYLRQRQVQRRRDEIIESGNLYALSDASQAEHEQAMQAVVQRFTSDYDLVRKNSGEANDTFEDADNGAALQNQIKDLVNSYARGEIEMEALVEERTRILNEYGRHVHQSDRNKGLLFADNIIEVAHNARSAAEHNISLDRIDMALKGHIGEAKLGVRTEARYEKVDKIVDKIYQSRVGGAVVNEAVLIGATSIAMNLAKVSTRKAVTALGATIGLGAGAAVIAGAREHYHIKQERQLHMRQMAEGGQMAENSKHRESLENTRYETVSAHELIDHLSTSMDAANLVGETDAGNLNDLIFHISRTQTMVDISDNRNLDLITFSDKTSVESERLALDIRLAEAKIALQNILDTTPSEQLNSSGISTTNSEELIARRIDLLNSALNKEISDKDRVFRKLRTRRTLGMAAVGAAAGITLGLGFQEAKSLVDDGLNGILTDHNNPDRDTLIAGFLDRSNGGGNGNGSDAFHLDRFDPHHLHHGGLQLPDGYKLNADGHSIIGPDSKPAVGGLDWSHNGQLSDASIDALKDKGFGVDAQAMHYMAHHNVTDKVHHSPHEFFRHGHHGFVRDTRELWYDNNTPAPVFDQNELRMDWGASGTGIDDHGNYVFNVSRMTADGSFHDGLSANAQHLAHEGKLVVALSMTKDSQHFVHLVHVDAHGNAIIDKDSVAGQSMFTNDGGHAKFVGAYAETSQILSQSKEHGVHTRMLATVVGENHAHSFNETIHHTVSDPREYHITHIDPPETDGIRVEIPPAIPIYARRGLENLNNDIGIRNPNVVGGYYGGRSLEELQNWIKENPARLRTRKEVSGAGGRTRWIEADGSEVKRDVAREKATISNYLNNERNKHPDHFALAEKVADSMPLMGNECRVAINVPAWMEGRNLGNFLEQYTSQKDKSGNVLDPKLYEINVLINRKTGSAPDQSVKVIEDFITKFESEHGFKPKVNYHDVEIDPPNNNVGYARKLLTDAVMIRNLKRTSQSAPLYIETEDADMIRIDPKTVNNVIETMDNNPQLDAVRGVQDRAPEYMKDNDMLFIRRRGHDFLELMARGKKFRDPSNPNWNFTWNRVVTGGWNTAYSAEAYALIEGYDSVEAGEDMSIGERITMVRGNGSVPNLEVIGKVYTRSDSSPRRFINEIRSDRSAYDDFANEEDNRIIREQSIESAMNSISKYKRINEANESDFTNYVKYLHSFSKSVTPNDTAANQLTKRVMFWLGFKKDDYDLSGNELNIKNWNNVKEALSRYRRRYEARLAVSS